MIKLHAIYYLCKLFSFLVITVRFVANEGNSARLQNFPHACKCPYRIRPKIHCFKSHHKMEGIFLKRKCIDIPSTIRQRSSAISFLLTISAFLEPIIMKSVISNYTAILFNLKPQVMRQSPGICSNNAAFPAHPDNNFFCCFSFHFHRNLLPWEAAQMHRTLNPACFRTDRRIIK